ncbi:protein phosphatase [Oscillatoria sp. CS-180]|uniref:phosphatase domain-containing putative toxin n=1 Tax=Oscillatoria sp. CS-180 TaxID=3021720 RepID=UPI00232DA615|nr:protein phosphatase [Oscillatoria sp. CS-180]MDB9527987.1 protein phosphatase [Oscillatoria sp. CS-180]
MTQSSLEESVWWLIPGKLAGMRKPHISEVNTLGMLGVGAVVSVMDDPSNLEAYEAAKLPFLWLPTTGGTAPTRQQIEGFRTFAVAQIAAGRAVAVHCSSGRRRTATFLGAYRILMGAGYEEVLEAIARANPRVEMRAVQLDFLKTLATE